MTRIKSVKGRQVFDSRGNPTVEAEIFLENGISANAISPSGASTGAFEAHELRDQNNNKFLGKSVNIAVENINNKILVIFKLCILRFNKTNCKNYDMTTLFYLRIYSHSIVPRNKAVINVVIPTCLNP